MLGGEPDGQIILCDVFTDEKKQIIMKGTPLYAKKININLTISDAFFESAIKYQAQLKDSDAIARAVGYNAAKNDRLTSSYSYAPSAASNLSSFSILKTVTIPHNGIII